VAMPKQGIAFPGSEFLDALDDLDTGAAFDFAIHLQMRSRDLELTRNDRAKNNIDDQFGQRPTPVTGTPNYAPRCASSPNTTASSPTTPTNAPWRRRSSSPSAPPTPRHWTTASNASATP
jgi:hypothetical protein